MDVQQIVQKKDFEEQIAIFVSMDTMEQIARDVELVFMDTVMMELMEQVHAFASRTGKDHLVLLANHQCVKFNLTMHLSIIWHLWPNNSLIMFT